MSDQQAPRRPLRDRIAMPKIMSDLENAISKVNAARGGERGDIFHSAKDPNTGVVTVTRIDAQGRTQIVDDAPLSTYRGQDLPPQAAPVSPGRGNSNEFVEAVNRECGALFHMLCEKNAKYGNSAMEPIRVFSDAHPIEQILVRIDDKLSRIRNGHTGDGEDTVFDLLGYLVLLRIAQQGIR